MRDGSVMGFMSGGMVADSVSEGFCNYLDYDGWTISARPNAVTRNARKMLDSRCGYNRPVENNE